MKKNNFTKNLVLHIRYPWTAICLIVLWVGMALMSAVLNFTTNEIMLLVVAAGGATLIIALVGFRA